MSIEYIRALKKEAGNPKKKKLYSIPKLSKKKAARDKADREERGGGDTELQKWYKGRQRFLTGECIKCKEKYNHRTLAFAIAATAHVLPKRKNMFPSVATHPCNFIELPASCGCHNWYDNKASWEEIKESSIWPIVLEKVIMMYPDIAEEERYRIPDVFRPYLREFYE